MIPGYERPMHIRATLAALRRERLNPWSESHAIAVDAQIGLFEAELARMEAEGIEDEPDPNDDPNPAHGTRDAYGAWVGRS